MQVLMFSKMLQSLPFERFAEVVREMGFDGVDLTVRPNGHVLPEKVKTDLPAAIRTLQSAGLKVPMITTAITDAKEPYAEDIVATAHECGVRFLKLGYWRYEGFGRLKEQIQETQRKLEGLQILAQRYGVTFAVHSHSGNCLSADAAVVYMMLSWFDPKFIGAYIDPGHMVVEGGLTGWKMGMDLLSDYICLVAVKDFGWFKETDEKGEVRWRPKVIPLKEGIVPWQEVFACLRQIGFEGCLSLHSEYHDVSTDQLIAQTREDLTYLRQFLTT